MLKDDRWDKPPGRYYVPGKRLLIRSVLLFILSAAVVLWHFFGTGCPAWLVIFDFFTLAASIGGVLTAICLAYHERRAAQGVVLITAALIFVLAAFAYTGDLHIPG